VDLLLCVQLREGKSQEVYVEFNPRFERIWPEAKKRLPEYMAKKPSNTALRSQYALRLYGWAKKHVEAGTTGISLEDLRKVLGLPAPLCLIAHGTFPRRSSNVRGRLRPTLE
jgi:hypothetical protein